MTWTQADFKQLKRIADALERMNKKLDDSTPRRSLADLVDVYIRKEVIPFPEYRPIPGADHEL